MKVIKPMCNDCPYIADQRDYRSNMKECFCAKVGGKISDLEVCDTEVVNRMTHNDAKPRLHKYKRDVIYKRHIKHIARSMLNKRKKYWYSVYLADHDGNYVDNLDDFVYTRREYRGSRSKYLKRLSNRKLRRFAGEVGGRGGYRRLFDFWWELD